MAKELLQFVVKFESVTGFLAWYPQAGKMAGSDRLGGGGIHEGWMGRPNLTFNNSTPPISGVQIVWHNLLVWKSSSWYQSFLELPWFQQHPQPQAVVVRSDYGSSLTLHCLYGTFRCLAHLQVHLCPEPLRALDNKHTYVRTTKLNGKRPGDMVLFEP